MTQILHKYGQRIPEQIRNRIDRILEEFQMEGMGIAAEEQRKMAGSHESGQRETLT